MIGIEGRSAAIQKTHLRRQFDLPQASVDLPNLLRELIESPPKRFENQDIAYLNLLCAQSLKGADDLDIRSCLNRLDRLTDRVEDAIKRNIYKQPHDPQYRHCEPKWRMSMLVTVMKLNFGVAYNPTIMGKRLEFAPMDNARDVFLGGVLDENPHRRHGTCASIPVLVTSIARRLGYPVGLAVAGRHILARWDSDGLIFNIEASNPLGMTSQTDEHYRNDLIARGNRADAVQNPYFFRILTPVEEFALFLTFRAECLIYAGRFTESLHVCARALQYAPDDPIFTSWAIRGARSLITQRTGRNPLLDWTAPEGVFEHDVRGHLKPDERADFMTIWAHRREVAKKFKLAQDAYEEACRERQFGWHEMNNLQGFLRRHKMPSRPKGIPKDSYARPRFCRLNCKSPDEAFQKLMNMAHDFEVKGDLVRARDALQDLYLLAPSDHRVFIKARQIENHPDFQRQWDAFTATLPENKRALPI